MYYLLCVASVNTTSIREEIARIEQDLARHTESGKLSDENRVLFNSLLMIVNMLVATFVEKSTRKTSKNSSIPSSQTGEDKSTKPSKGNAEGTAQNDEPLDNGRTVETNEVSEVNACKHCGENLSTVSVLDHERRTRIDIVFEKRVEHTDAQIKRCPCCDKLNKREFAADLVGPVQYGLGVKAYILNLLITQMVSLSRAQKRIKTLIGSAISEAVMLKYILQLHEALEAWEQDAINQLLASPFMHLDESSLRLDKKNYWAQLCIVLEILRSNDCMLNADQLPLMTSTSFHATVE